MADSFLEGNRPKTIKIVRNYIGLDKSLDVVNLLSSDWFGNIFPRYM